MATIKHWRPVPMNRHKPASDAPEEEATTGRQREDDGKESFRRPDHLRAFHGVGAATPEMSDIWPS